MTLTHGSLRVELLPELAAWLPDHRLVLISDVHLGKGAFFREHGIPVPDGAFADDLQRISHLIETYQADICVVGDLVHASRNDEWKQFAEVRSTWPASVILVAGNHDTYATGHAEELGITVVDHLLLDDVLLQHHPDHDVPNEYAEQVRRRICGHRHPSITINGPAHQRVRSRCFHLQGSTLILPGFGRFTGTHPVEWKPDDRIFIPVGTSVVEVPRELSPR